LTIAAAFSAIAAAFSGLRVRASASPTAAAHRPA
jgi:hypothetical protein